MLIEKEDAIKAICEACYMYKYIGEHYRDCKYYPCDDVVALEAVPEAPKPSGEFISRADAIEAVELADFVVDGGAKVVYEDDLLDRLNNLPSASYQQVGETQAAEAFDEMFKESNEYLGKLKSAEAVQGDGKMIPIELKKRYPHSRDEDITDAFMRGYQAHAEAVQGWIPCSERLPENIRPVIVTWKNTDPASYYQYIVGKHFTGTACYKNGKWYWYSSTTEDMLAEYGRYDSEEFDEAIECIAWMPLPEAYKGGDTE